MLYRSLTEVKWDAGCIGVVPDEMYLGPSFCRHTWEIWLISSLVPRPLFNTARGKGVRILLSSLEEGLGTRLVD